MKIAVELRICNIYIYNIYDNPNPIFSIYDFFAAKPQKKLKSKYRWFKVVRFGGG